MKKNLLILTLIGITLLSCSKTESDFVGTYKVNNLKYLKVPNKSSFMDFYTKKNARRTTARNNKVLTPATLTFFIDESDKKLKGEMEYVEKSVEQEPSIGGFSHKTTRTKYDFELKNMRIVSDTLFFTISNQLTELSGKTFKGFVYKEKDQSFVGIDEEFTGRSGYRQDNPWYKSEQNGFLVFQAGLSESKEIEFYRDQLTILEDSISNNELDKEIVETIENSIEYLNVNYLKDGEE